MSLNLGAQKICPMHHHLPHHRIQSVDPLCVPDFQNNLQVSCSPKTHWMNSDEPHLKNPNLLQLRTQLNKSHSHRLPPQPTYHTRGLRNPLCSQLAFPPYNFLIPSLQSADVAEAVVSPDTPPAALSVGADAVQLSFSVFGALPSKRISQGHTPFR